MFNLSFVIQYDVQRKLIIMQDFSHVLNVEIEFSFYLFCRSYMLSLLNKFEKLVQHHAIKCILAESETHSL